MINFSLINEQLKIPVEFVKLESLVNSIRTGLNPRQNFKLNTNDATNFYVTVKEITSGKILFSDKTDLVNNEALATIQKRSNLERGDVLLSGIGTIGKVAVADISTDNWNCSESIILIKPDKNKINSKFLKYYLETKEIQKTFLLTSVGSTLKGIRINDLKNLKIPKLSLEVQGEIVRILDNFAELTAELTAELFLRKSQANFYKNYLLNIYSGERCKIKDKFIRLHGTPITANKMKEIANPDGDVRIFAGGKTQVNAFKDEIPNLNLIKVPAVLVQSRGLIDFIYYDKPFTFKNEMWAYSFENKTTTKFLYYILKNNLSYFRDASSGMGAMPQISLKITEDFCIDLPSLEKQEKIVNCLDKFEKLNEDIHSGLPAEIKMRQQQYEYYRDKLLTFKEKDSENK